MNKRRMLKIDDEARAKVAAVIRYAEQHHYHPETGEVPADDPNLVIQLNDYRCVFSFTHADNTVWRHLSMSVPNDAYPHPAAAFLIADAFGFTGLDMERPMTMPAGWIGGVNEKDHCVVLAQELPKPETLQ